MCVRMSMRAHMFPQHRTRSRKLGASARRAPLRKEALGSAAVPAAYSEGLGGLVAVAGLPIVAAEQDSGTHVWHSPK